MVGDKAIGNTIEFIVTLTLRVGFSFPIALDALGLKLTTIAVSRPWQANEATRAVAGLNDGAACDSVQISEMAAE